MSCHRTARATAILAADGERLLLGAGGMLGSMLVRVLGRDPDLKLTTTVCPTTPGSGGSVPFDAREGSLGRLLDSDAYDWIINAIGVIKPRIDERNITSVENAISINALFPTPPDDSPRRKGALPRRYDG